MRRDDAIRILKEHEAELRERGVLHLRIFGSVARDEATSESDVDLLADFDPEKRIGLIAMVSLQDRLTDIFRISVHLATSGGLRSRTFEHVSKEAVSVF